MSADTWLSTTLGAVAEFGNGGAWNQDEYAADGIRVVRVSDVKGDTLDLSECKYLSMGALDRYARHQLRTGDLIICTVGSHPTQPASVVGRAVVVPRIADGALLNQNAVRIRPAVPLVDAGWLGFLGRSRWFHAYIIGCAGGAASQVRMPIGLLKEMPIAVPPLPTQRRIATILAAYDDLIENHTRRIAILEEMARRIYEEWFVRFRFPGHEGVRMVESELGLVPEGWRAGTVADVAIVYRGRSYKGSELAESGGRPFVNLKCMEREGGFRASGLKRYTGEFKDSQTVRPGDMVMGITDMTQERRIVARVGRVSGLDADFGVFSMDLVRIASRGEYTEPYLYAMFRWSGFADEVKQHANGANVLHLLPARIEEFAFARPAPELAAKFADLFAPMLSLCDKLGRKNANLRTMRDLLLPKLISGELDVSAVPEPEAAAA